MIINAGKGNKQDQFEFDLSKSKRSEPKQTTRPGDKYFKQSILSLIEMEIAQHISHHNANYLNDIE